MTSILSITVSATVSIFVSIAVSTTVSITVSSTASAAVTVCHLIAGRWSLVASWRSAAMAQARNFLALATKNQCTGRSFAALAGRPSETRVPDCTCMACRCP